MTKEEIFSNCRRLYKDILKGYSYVPYHKLYIKHFKETDIGEISELKESITLQAKEKGLLSEEDKIQLLIDGDLWTIEKQQEIQSLSEQISNHQQAKSKLFIKSQLAAVQRQIDSKSEKLSVLLQERGGLVGLTSEKFAEKAAKHCLVIDNSSFYRMDPDVPLIVPQVNSDEIKNIKKNIIANPNCFVFNQVFPGGFTPSFGGDVMDFAIAAGIKGTTKGGTMYDVSLSIGENTADYYIENTLNGSLGPKSPTQFNPGSYIQLEKNFNVDLVKQVKVDGWASDLNVGYGLELSLIHI